MIIQTNITGSTVRNLRLEITLDGEMVGELTMERVAYTKFIELLGVVYGGNNLAPRTHTKGPQVKELEESNVTDNTTVIPVRTMERGQKSTIIKELLP